MLTDSSVAKHLIENNKSVQNAIIEQMSEVSYCHSLFYATRAAEDLAKLLFDSTNGELSRAFFVSSGSEAMEAALKLARQYHLEKPNPQAQRTLFISRQQSYHGTTLGALAAGGHVARRAIFEPILSINTSRVSPCYAYRGLTGGADDEAAFVKRLEAELQAEFQRVGPMNVAAFIAEPVVGESAEKSRYHRPIDADALSQALHWAVFRLHQGTFKPCEEYVTSTAHSSSSTRSCLVQVASVQNRRRYIRILFMHGRTL